MKTDGIQEVENRAAVLAVVGGASGEGAWPLSQRG